MKKGRILVVEDNQGIRNALKILLPAHFAQVNLIPSPVTMLSEMDSFRPDAVLLDMNFHTEVNTGGEGLYWTGELKRRYPDVQVVLFTAYADIALAVEGMKRGAFDFIVKPWDNDRLVSTLEAAVRQSKSGRKGPVGSEGEKDASSDMYWGADSRMQQLRRTVEKIAPTDANVLITGENGTGKEVLARQIHRLSARSSRPMVCVDAGAISESLFESELFGHVKGAFTDARSDHKGKFEQADGSSLFLDEIGNVPLHLQSRLLRVLQSREVCRLGSEKAVPIDIRLICATNMDIPAMVAEGRFREDLHYRINTVCLHLPPLRERSDDIIPLARRFMLAFAAKYHRNVTDISEEACRMLMSRRWPGNVRELQNAVEKAVIMADGLELGVRDFEFGAGEGFVQAAARQEVRTLDDAERNAICDALQRCRGNLTLVARELGISRPTLYAKLKKYGL